MTTINTATIDEAARTLRAFGDAMRDAYAGPIAKLSQALARLATPSPDRLRRMRAEYGRRRR